MKWAPVAAMILTFHGAAGAENPPQIVKVCMDRGIHWAITFSAQLTISKTFADIGIKIQWADPHHNHCSADSIVITFPDVEPAQRPQALAYALPFEGRHIVVFPKRIKDLNLKAKNQTTVLAYVIAHEIGHILMGKTCHSAKGIMKAYWSQDEYTEMFTRGLAFLPQDVADIFASLDHWRAQVAVTTLADQSAGRR